MRTTAASGLFKDRVPTQDAEVVRRLKAAGAVLLGKTNLHEFAYGGSSAMQISGPPGAEATVLRLAHAYEQATEWHKRTPATDSQ